MPPKYTKLEKTDNLDFGPGLVDVDLDDSINQIQNTHDDDDDIFITPDVQTTANKQLPPPPPPAKPTSMASSPNGNSSNEPFFNFSSFITPQIGNSIGDSFGMQIETRERPFSGGNTLDESVLTTLHRDLATIGDKLLSILWPLRLRQSLLSVQKISERISGGIGNATGNDVEDAIGSDSANYASGNQDEYSSDTMKKIRDWDLWGPLVINLMFSLIITYLQSKSLDSGDKDTSSQIFSAAFTLIWASLAILSINIQLLSPVQQKLENGGVTNGVVGLSFFQCVSLLSYSMFPIVIGGLISCFVPFKFIRLIINLVMLLWSLLCTWLIIAIVSNCKKRGTLTLLANEDDSQGDQRIFLMVYPVFLVYGLFSWFCVIV